jgi:hypothetical protein
MRGQGFDVSTWYPAIHRWYQSGRAQPPDELANALFIEQNVLNLWVDPGMDADRIRATCAALQAALEARMASPGSRSA